MDLREEIRRHILESYLPGEDPSQLQDDDNLIESGVLDSMSIARFVGHLQSTYGVRISPSEIVYENLGSVNGVTRFMEKKRGEAGR